MTLPLFETGVENTSLSKFDKDEAGNLKYYTRSNTGESWTENTANDAQLTNAMIEQLGKQENVNKYTRIGTVAIIGKNQTANVKVQDYGFYYISTSVGSVAAIDTTHPNIRITDKTLIPTLEKKQSLTDGSPDLNNKAADDSTYSTNPLSVSIGDTVYYSVPITISRDCVKPFIITDLISEGLTMDASNHSVIAEARGTNYDFGTSIGSSDAWSGDFTHFNIDPWSQYVVSIGRGVFAVSWTQVPGDFDQNGNAWIEGTSNGQKYKKYTVTTPPDLMRYLSMGGHHNDVTETTYTFTLYYKATLNANAQNEHPEKNRVSLTYEQYTSPFHEVQVTPYGFDLVKTDKDNKVLGLNATNGGIGNTGSYATFKLYKANADGSDISGDPISFVETPKTVAEDDSSDNNKGLIYNYRVATADEKSTATSTIKAGDVRISGLAAGTYYLVEDKAPDGYNKITSNVKVVVGTDDITVGNNNTARYATVTTVETGTSGPKSATYTSGGVEVENQAGTVLPSTGGIGTTIFYIAGGVIIVIAVILLVRRKKNNQ